MFSHHHLLRRQLKKTGVDLAVPPSSAEQWQKFIDRINRTYMETDQERYLLERSQEISSHEMRELYLHLEEAQRIAGVGNWSIDLPEGKEQYSKECLRILDLPAAPLGSQWQELALRIPPGERTTLEQHLRAALHQGLDFDLVFRLSARSGETRWIHAIGRPIRTTDGTVQRLHGTVMDITQRILAEQLQSMERKIAHLLIDATTHENVVLKIIQAVCEARGWAGGTLWKLDQPEALLRRSATWTEPEASIMEFMDAQPAALPLPAWPMLVGHAPPPGESVWIADLASATAFPRAAATCRAGLRMVFAFPIETERGLLGIMELFSRQAQAADRDMLRSAHFIGRHLGQFFQRERSERALRESEAHFRSLVEQASDSFYMHDVEGRIIDVNQRGCDSLGYTRLELLSMSIADIDADATTPQFRERLERIAPKSPISLESRYRRKDGSFFPVELSIGLIDVGNRRCFLSLARDVTERKKLQDRIHHQAFHDLLTNLPNRAKLNCHLSHAIAQAQQNSTGLAVLLIDLDRFKNINDTLGHDAGDRLLQEMARRISACIRTGDTILHDHAANGMVARLGGDEFIVLVEEIDDAASVGHIAQRILANIVKAYPLENQLIHMTASIGISLYPQDGVNGYLLMKHADVAMYRAKERGKNTFAFYSVHMDAYSTSQLALESGLHQALERDELVLYYQAKVNARTGRIVGAEVLVRWCRTDHGLLQPMEFIPLAEETGLIVPLSRWVLEKACLQNLAWQAQGLPPLHIAVNLSPRHFMDDNVEQDFVGILHKTGMNPRLLELEVTESMVMHNADAAIRILTRLKEMGVRIAIDDFGVGYSSLAQVKHFPIDIIKIDRSFIVDVPGAVADEALIDAIIAMGKSMKITLVAEGVETRQQLQFLVARGCDEIQGYFFSKPLPADAFMQLVRDNLHLLAGDSGEVDVRGDVAPSLSSLEVKVFDEWK